MSTLLKGKEMQLNYSEAHKFVRAQRRKGVDIRWDGWDILIFKPTHNGYTSRHGAFRNRRWGIESRVSVDNEGLWNVT